MLDTVCSVWGQYDTQLLTEKRSMIHNSKPSIIWNFAKFKMTIQHQCIHTYMTENKERIHLIKSVYFIGTDLDEWNEILVGFDQMIFFTVLISVVGWLIQVSMRGKGSESVPTFIENIASPFCQDNFKSYHWMCDIFRLIQSQSRC